MAGVEVVAAWYGEHLGWLADHGVPPEVVTVYDKRGDLELPCVRVAKLPNVGREGHTYLHHIVENYDRLAAVTYFCQGNPMDHGVDHMFESIHGGGADVLSFLPFGHGHVVTRLTCVHWPDGGPVMESMARDLFSSGVPETFVFLAGANFAATREAIRGRSRAFWEAAKQKVATEDKPPEIYAVERFWPLFFEPGVAAATHLVSERAPAKNRMTYSRAALLETVRP